MAEKTPEQLQAEIDSLTKKVGGLEKSNAKLKQQREDLNDKLKVKEATAGSKLPSVKSGDDHYIFTGPKARVGKETVKAEDAAKDQKLIDSLVARKSGWLKKVDIK